LQKKDKPVNSGPCFYDPYSNFLKAAQTFFMTRTTFFLPFLRFFFRDLIYLFFFPWVVLLGVFSFPQLLGKKLKAGFSPLSLLGEDDEVVFLTASVGEAKIAFSLAQSLREDGVEGNFFFLSQNLSGFFYYQQRLLAKKKTKIMDKIALVPFDFSFFIFPFLKRIPGKRFIVVESEFWPNFLESCGLLKKQVLVVNARLSAGTYLLFRWLRPLLFPALLQVSRFFYLSDSSFLRFQQLGLPVEKLEKMLSLKYKKLQPHPREDLEQECQKFFEKKPKFLAVVGSLQPEEVDFFLAPWQKFKEETQNSALVLILRHESKKKSLTQKLKKAGIRFLRQHSLGYEEFEKNIFVISAFGILPLWYELCDCAFVGGTFNRRGGQNFLEPLSYEKPTAIGPHNANFEAELALFLPFLWILKKPSDGYSFLHAVANQEESALKKAKEGLLCLEKNKFDPQKFAQQLKQTFF